MLAGNVSLCGERAVVGLLNVLRLPVCAASTAENLVVDSAMDAELSDPPHPRRAASVPYPWAPAALATCRGGVEAATGRALGWLGGRRRASKGGRLGGDGVWGERQKE